MLCVRSVSSVMSMPAGKPARAAAAAPSRGRPPDDVRAGLALDLMTTAAPSFAQAARRSFLGGVLECRRDVRDAHGGPVLPGDDEVLVLVRGNELVVRVHRGCSSRWPVEAPLRPLTLPVAMAVRIVGELRPRAASSAGLTCTRTAGRMPPRELTMPTPEAARVSAPAGCRHSRAPVAAAGFPTYARG